MGHVMAGLGPAMHDEVLAVRLCGEKLRTVAIGRLAVAAPG
jgi:hypothetical protein